MSQQGAFWHGPIEDEQHARKVVELAAGWFTVVPALGGIGSLLSGGLDAPLLITLIVTIMPPAVLWRTKNPAAAVALLVVTILGWLSVMLATAVAFLGRTGGGFEYAAVALSVLWGLLVLASYRAWRAAHFLKVMAPDPAAERPSLPRGRQLESRASTTPSFSGGGTMKLLWPSSTDPNPALINRVGRVVHWLFTSAALICAATAVWVAYSEFTTLSEYGPNYAGVLVACIFGGATFFIGRAARYILSGE